MNQYFLVDRKDAKPYLLSPVTARVEKALAEIGLSKADFVKAQELVDKWLNECGEDIIKLCNIIFRGDVLKKEDAADIDKSVVKEGVLDFFLSDLMLMSKYGNSSVISSLVKMGKMTEQPN